MANSSLTVTGGNVDTETQTGGDHRQVMVIGDPTATNVASVSTTGALRTDRTIDGQRTRVSMTYTSSAPVVADTLLSMSLNKAGTVTSVTTVPVTSGKILRITSIIVALRATAATLPYGLLTVRINDTGAALIGSPPVSYVGVSGNAAVIGNTGVTSASIEDGLEVSGTQQIGFSFSNNVTTNVANISILGYEYSA